MKKMIGRYASHGICVSRKAAEALFGDAWESDGRWRLLFCGIDLSPFGENVGGERVRRELGIPEKAYVIGHVGNFREQKNHVYLMDIAASLVESGADCYWFLLIGDGPLRPRIKRRAEELGLADKVIFAGARSDVPKLMLGAMDLFLFPSLYEGLGVALLEAQAAGLPCVISDVIAEEIDVIKENMHRLSLGEPPAVWADAIQAIRKSRKVCSQKECVEMMKNSRFNIATCVSQIEELYSGG
jgi:glycosyltransferase involved in cell wall biosynthesis